MGDIASFENYCIICDRLIVAPREPELAEKKPRKKAQGAIRIKNPDGSTTIRTANGVKTTRPGLPRRPSAVVADKPSESTRSNSTDSSSSTASVTEPVQPIPVASTEPAFVSNIYCSRKCAEQDAGASGPAAYENMARAFGLGITTTSDAILVPGHIGSMITSPPSPLLSSDTDTGSSATSASMAPPVNVSPASVPMAFDFFRPEDATRPRRSSLAHASRFSITPFEPLIASQQMSRQRSSASSCRPRSTASATSTDSLLSLWQGESDGLSRPPSTSSAVRSMTAIGNENPTYRRSSSDCPSTAPRPFLPRAALSHASLGGMVPSSSSSVAEVGSAPSQNAVLMHSYASAFPARDGSPMLKPVGSLHTSDMRSSSISNTPAVTIRSRPRTSSTTAGSWDAFGKAEVLERSRRSARMESGASSTDLTNGSTLSREVSSPELNVWRERADSIGRDATPKQSLEDGCWQIRYTRPSSRSGSHNRSASREPRTAPVLEDEPESGHTASVARPIPERSRTPSNTAIAGSNSTARSRTPQSSSRLANMNINRSGSTFPNLDALVALRIGSPCAPVLSSENASLGDTARSVPRAGFDWSESQHSTYELPVGVVVNPNKGLFYFKA